MNNSLLQFAYNQYAADIPHESIMQTLISKGANPAEAQHILDVATITYCTQSSQATQQAEPAEEEMSAGGIIKAIIAIISLLFTVVQCMT